MTRSARRLRAAAVAYASVNASDTAYAAKPRQRLKNVYSGSAVHESEISVLALSGAANCSP